MDVGGKRDECDRQTPSRPYSDRGQCDRDRGVKIHPARHENRSLGNEERGWRYSGSGFIPWFAFGFGMPSGGSVSGFEGSFQGCVNLTDGNAVKVELIGPSAYQHRVEKMVRAIAARM